MNRRALLGVLATGGSVVTGCLDDSPDSDPAADDGAQSAAGSTNSSAGRTNSSNGGDGNQSAETPTPPSDDTESAGTSLPVPDPTGECGVATEPLSSRIVDDTGRLTCIEGTELETSVELANERADAVSVTAVIESDGEPVFEGTYDLGPGERALEDRVGPVGDLEDVRIEIDGEADAITGSFGEFTCRRHAVALTADGAEIGYVPPLSGPADTQHDCYTGDSGSIYVEAKEPPQTVTVSIVDHCEETTDEETIEFEDSGTEELADVLTGGGMFDIVADVAGGGAARYEFYEECWGLFVIVTADGTPEIQTIPVH